MFPHGSVAKTPKSTSSMGTAVRHTQRARWAHDHSSTGPDDPRTAGRPGGHAARRPVDRDRGAGGARAGARWWCSAPAGASRRCTSSPPNCCARPGTGPTVIVSPLLALMRNQVAAAERAGVRAATINSSNVADWDEIHQRVRDGDLDVLLVSPERLNNPDFRDAGAARVGARRRPGRGRRGALRVGLGPRLPARLPPHPHADRRTGHRRPGAGHHRHGQRPGGRRRGRPAGCRRTATPWCCAAGWTASRCGCRWSRRATRRSARRGLPHTSIRCRARASSTPSPSRRPTTSPRCCASRATRSPPTPVHRGRRTRTTRGRPAGQPGQGADRHVGAGHGLRQARPRLRRAPRRPVLADRVLPAGRPRGPVHRRAPRSSCCPATRTRTSGATSPPWRFRRKPWCAT